MHRIIESNVLLRGSPELLSGLRLDTDTFKEGWGFLASTNASGLEKKARKRGWHFFRIETGMLRSGVGDTAQEAIASALKLALRSINVYFNAAGVEHIELTSYPWFCLARVEVRPYRIQQTMIQCIPDNAMPLPATARKRRRPVSAPWLSPQHGGPMPLLRQALTQTGCSEARPQ